MTRVKTSATPTHCRLEPSRKIRTLRIPAISMNLRVPQTAGNNIGFRLVKLSMGGERMGTKLVSLWHQNQDRLKIGWLGIAVLAAIYYGSMAPKQAFRGISMQRESALADVENLRHQHWFQTHLPTLPESHAEGATGGVIGGMPGGVAKFQQNAEQDRKIARTSSLALVAEKPAEAAARIQQLAERAGGFLVSWEANGDKEATRVNVALCVPADRFEFTRAEIRKIAQRVESEQVQAEDVSRQYVDEEARLRNLRAEEAQYLAILKLARTVKDTLDVSEKLNQTRSDIEQQQSEFNTLSKQVELVAVNISLRKETEAQVFGLPWRPGYEFNLAARLGLEGVIDYATAILSFLFYLPAIALWLATFLAGAACSWRILRWSARKWFAGSKAPAVNA